jgi:hypothetical protein
MLSNVLAFDLRVFDPGAPIYQESTSQTILEPNDPGWQYGYVAPLGNAASGYSFLGQGAYVDLGYSPSFPTANPPWIYPWFAVWRELSHPNDTVLARGYAVYDTWSTSYENNAINEDGDALVDEATNGFDDNNAFGPDDVSERETRPPYDKPLRGVQVVLRVYETDARQIRQVRVNQHFLGE